ncbi:5-formyltetrahydrofolate cyclo-ligase [Undibacterium cyanobacteriorum]|uniref:5-formyltetrahydrofolate cyclo-ligase n=1 Tax=Undibacterium cyanobacteriorum TaxID=3073561 RepID=A0ABY9RL65_9BURK|nr:5-formyltetrahydrofolate cyclo-ligase [Undibacterium sp. 20NA77.5]WMW81444.1 5-formyltetrahydrofolate cyclo-ligase [Undibacterium sp. 20NA77.5]
MAISGNIDEKTLARRELRKLLKQRRSAILPAAKSQWDSQIAHKLSSLIRECKPQCLAVYWPIQSEPNLIACFEQLHHAGIALALPIVVGPAQALKFVAWIPGQEMELDCFGIPMPKQREIALEPDYVLAPCVGFNPSLFRLGYGGGFYDRTFAQLSKAKRIGIAYELSHTEFEPDQFDLALDYILTETQLYAQQT